MALSQKQIELTQWTADKADAAAPFITRKPNGTYWVGDRRLLLRNDRQGMDQVLRKVYDSLAPNTGYLAFFSAVQQEALGIPRKYAKDWLFSQEGYQLYQPTRKVSSSRAILSKGPLKRLAIDAGTFGGNRKSLWAGRTYSHFLVVVDLWTKYLWVVPLTADNTENTLKALRDIIKEVKPLQIKAIQHDSGPAYTSDDFKAFMKDQGIVDLTTSIAMPTSNGAAERSVRSVKRLLWSWHAVRRLPWAQLCSAVSKQINTTYRRVLGAGKTPAELLSKAKEDALGPEDKEQVQGRLAAVAKGRRNSLIYNSVLRPGDKVRLSLAYWGNPSEREERDTSKLGKAHWQNYSKQVFTIDRRVGKDYTLEEKPGYKYDRAMLLKIVKVPAAQAEEAPEPEAPAAPSPPRQRQPPRPPSPRPQRDRQARRDEVYEYY